MAKKKVFALKNAKKREPKRDEFAHAEIPEVEVTAADYLLAWRNALEETEFKGAQGPKTPKAAIKNAKLAKRGLKLLAAIELSDLAKLPPDHLIWVANLGAIFDRIGVNAERQVERVSGGKSKGKKNPNKLDDFQKEHVRGVYAAAINEGKQVEAATTRATAAAKNEFGKEVKRGTMRRVLNLSKT